MKPERWQKIERLYNSALELEPERRDAFLEQACAGDESVRKAVQQLLEHKSDLESFIESPAIEKLAQGITSDLKSSQESAFIIGRSIGRYQISEELGKGGMGEVYRAKDQRLGRNVAIKILPAEFTQDSDRVRRFEREAKLLASLNHPNIASLYELEEYEETHFLVLELIEGETLADRLKRGPIPVEESLNLALQIAEALEAAHEKGIIHRDLKPANIKITPDGKVKVLDFGLAKTFLRDQENLNVSDSPTLSATFTQKGFIIGTASYMSPEQAQGQAIDKRSDIWAFGCVLYEMLTGQSAFPGKTVTEILAAVILAEPEWTCLPANLHWRLREVLERCLKKELRDRYHDISDVRVDIQKILTDPNGVLMHPHIRVESRMRSRLILPWAAMTLIMLIIAGVAAWNLRNPEPRPIMRFDYDLPEGQHFSDPGYPVLDVSPDGRQILYSTSTGLFLRSIDELGAKLIRGTEGYTSQPFFSPDGKWIGYYSWADRNLMKISINGGAPVILCRVPLLAGAWWNTDNTIVYGQTPGDIMRISADGGIPESFIKAESGYLVWPQILPDQKSVLFQAVNANQSRIMVQSLESGERKELFSGDSARYLPTGHIVYAVGNSLMCVPFDIGKLEALGGGIPLIVNCFRGAPTILQYGISISGTLVYMPETAGGSTPGRTIVWVDMEGNEVPIEAPPNMYFYPKISPDGSKLAIQVRAEAMSNICVWDLVRPTLTQITFEGRNNGMPVWTADGKHIAFFSMGRTDSQNAAGVYWKAADGSGHEEELGSIKDRLFFPSCWSDDGKILVGMETPDYQKWDVGMLSLEGEHERKLLLQENYAEAEPQISPDGKWMAYSSNESERVEVYVRPFPEVDSGKWQVSTSGGHSALWSPDSRELFYLNPDAEGIAVMAVSVETEPSFNVHGTPRVLFRGKYVNSSVDSTPWDISPDGKRFLMIKPAGTTDDLSTAVAPRRIIIVTNWFEELKERVPVP